MNIAVILARGGSKRIPRKNIKKFCGKPMIAWPIETAKKSKLFDHILVSTDNEEIAKISKSFGAEVPFIRPKNLSDDFTGTTEVITHAVKWMEEQKWQVKIVCCIYATSVFFTVEDLKKGFQVIHSDNWSFSLSVTEFEYSIFRSFKDSASGGIEMFFPEHFKKRSQDLPVAMHDAGQFYWGKPSAWVKNLKIFDSHSFPIKIPHWRIQDIDTEDDWKRAEVIFSFLN